MFKALIVNPPISIHYPATAVLPLPCLVIGRILKNLQEKGFDFTYELLDLDLLLKTGDGLKDSREFYEKAVSRILEKQPDACFLSTHAFNLSIAVQLCDTIKKNRPEILTVLGGMSATLQARDIIENFDSVDIVLKGEAEPVLPELIKQALGNRDFRNVPSTVMKYNGCLIDNPQVHMSNEDEFLFPDYSLIDIEVYRRHNEKNPYISPGFAVVESGRGCRFNCRFCAPAKMWGRKPLYRPVKEIINEMRFLKEHGFDYIFFSQDNMDVSFIRELASELIKENLEVFWAGYARIDQIDDELLALMAESGCKSIFVGLETPNPNSQKYIRKIADKSEMLKRIQQINKYGIMLLCSFIAGFDGETEEEFSSTLEFALECSASSDIQILKKELSGKKFEELSGDRINFCLIRPLAAMPGTDSYKETESRLKLFDITYYEESINSELFGFNEFIQRHWKHMTSPYITHLDEEKISFIVAVLRIFNFVNARPFQVAWILERKNVSLLRLLRDIVNKIGIDKVLNPNMQELEQDLTGIFGGLVCSDTYNV